MSTAGVNPAGHDATTHPTPRSIEQTAREQVSREILSILPAGSFKIIPFTQANFQQTWKYDTSASKPTLHPLLRLRLSKVAEFVEEEVWPVRYDELIERLPPAVKARLIFQNSKPFAERDIDYVILNNLIIFFAQTLDWIERASQSAPPDSPAEVYNNMNMVLPYIALEAIITKTETTIKEIAEYLENLGANYQHFDSLTNLVREFRVVHQNLKHIQEDLKTQPPPSDLNVRMKNLASRISRLNDEFQRTEFGEAMTILRSTISAMTVITSAIALSYGSPPLLISLSMLSIGLHESESEAGIIGADLGNLINEVLNDVISFVSLGTGTELQEMQDLRDALIQFQGGQ